MASNFHAGDHTDQFPVPSYGNRIETIVKVAMGGGPNIVDRTVITPNQARLPNGL